MKDDSLFENEKEVLKYSEIILEKYNSAETIPKDDYIRLKKNYKKLFKQLKLLVRMGDIQQNKLNKLNEKLDIQNDLIKKTFGRYLSDDIVDCILESPKGAALGGEKIVVTILLTDIRGFTAITERESAENIVGMLNNYLEIMTEIIFKYGGTIDEIIGDSLLVIFGAPVKSNDHADRAVSCAVEMQNAMQEVNKKNKESGFPEIEMGIGVNTGELIVGNIGSDKRTKYAVVGSNVNLTSRIESYTFGGQIFISESSLNTCKSKLIIDSDFEVKPKGVAKPIKIFSLNGIDGENKIYLKKEITSLIELKHTIPIILSSFDGKHETDVFFNGEILKTNIKEAILITNADLKKFTNINISILDEKTHNNNKSIFGKIINKSKTGDNSFEYTVHFTAVPENFGEIIKKYEK